MVACDDEIVAKCHGPIRGSEDQLSSFRSEISGMASATFLFSRIAQEIYAKTDVSMWTDNSSLAGRLTNLCELNPIGAYLQSDHDLYSIIQKSLKELRVVETGHVNGHQDREGRTLTTTEKLNVVADKLATEPVRKAIIRQPEWCKEFSPLLIIQGKVITKKKV